MIILHGNLKLGGRGKTIEIDESMFGHKRKYNRGRVSQGTWVFGMVERGTGQTLAFRVPNRTRETLAMNRTVKSKLPSYLDEYNWQKCYPGDLFDNLLEAIAEFCPPN